MDKQVHPIIHQDISIRCFHTHTHTHVFTVFLSLLECETGLRDWRRLSDRLARDCAPGASPTPCADGERDKDRERAMNEKQKKKEQLRSALWLSGSVVKIPANVLEKKDRMWEKVPLIEGKCWLHLQQERRECVWNRDQIREMLREEGWQLGWRKRDKGWLKEGRERRVHSLCCYLIFLQSCLPLNYSSSIFFYSYLIE